MFLIQLWKIGPRRVSSFASHGPDSNPVHSNDTGLWPQSPHRSNRACHRFGTPLRQTNALTNRPPVLVQSQAWLRPRMGEGLAGSWLVPLFASGHQETPGSPPPKVGGPSSLPFTLLFPENLNSRDGKGVANGTTLSGILTESRSNKEELAD